MARIFSDLGLSAVCGVLLLRRKFRVSTSRILAFYPSADELALELHEFALLLQAKTTEGEVTISEKEAIERLDLYLGSLSWRQHEFLWAAEALTSAGEWKTVRTMASECLHALTA